VVDISLIRIVLHCFIFLCVVLCFFVFHAPKGHTLKVALRRADTFFAKAKNIVRLFAGRGEPKMLWRSIDRHGIAGQGKREAVSPPETFSGFAGSGYN
jgi:hypothetical protein